MASSRKLWLAAILLMTIFTTAQADWGEGIELIGEYQVDLGIGGSNALVMGDLVYILNGDELELWNYIDPAEPVFMRSDPTPLSGGEMMLHNDLLIITQDSRISIFNVEDPENPQYLSTIQGPIYDYIDPVFRTQYFRRADLTNTIATGNSLVSLDNGVHFTVIDISDPSDPQLTESLVLENELHFLGGKVLAHNDQVVAFGMHRFNEDDTQILTFNIEQGELILESTVYCDFRTGVFSGPARAIIHGDEILFSIEEEGIHGVDYSDPDNPVLIGEIDVRRVDAPFYFCNMKLTGDRLYVPFFRNTEIYDLSEGFRNIQHLGEIDYFTERDFDENPFIGAGPLIFDEDYEGVMVNDDLWVYDVSDPDNIVRIRGGAIEPGAPKQTVNEIAMLEDIVYISGDANTYLVSIENPEEPEHIENLPMVNTSSSLLMLEEQEILYVGNPLEQYAYNLDPPDDPGLLEQVPNDAFDQRWIEDVQGDIALGVNRYEIMSFDLSDPLNPELLVADTLNHRPDDQSRFSDILDTYVFDNDFYIFGHGFADDPEIFWYDIGGMLDREDPVGPELVSSVNLGELDGDIDMVYSVCRTQEYVYVVTGKTYYEGRMLHPGDNRLLIMDIWFEEILTETPLPFPGQLNICGDLLYLVNAEFGIRIFDAVNPEQELIGWYDTPGNLTQIIVGDDLIIAADTYGLRLYRIGEGNEGTVGEQVKTVPDQFTVSECYPNPFNGVVSFSMYLPHRAEVDYQLFDVSGRLVQAGTYGIQKSGYHRKTLDCSGFNSGIYFLNAESNGQRSIQRIVLIK